MCYHVSNTKTAAEIEAHYEAEFEYADYAPVRHINGFQHPNLPVITDTDRDMIQLYSWGLLPRWAKNTSISNNTLNARYETLAEKPAFRESVHTRCLVICDGIYDWQDLGKNNKQCFHITHPDKGLFSLAGLYSIWKNPADNKVTKSFTIVTKVANPVFQHLHNYCEDDRMLFMLTRAQEQAWLNGEHLEASMDIPLIATPVASVLKKGIA
jgi:putative SOS response-associated peptidase YedK